MISPTTPAMFFGLAMLALPIAAHLLHRHARRKLVFPTVQLLLASAATQSQLFKLRRWILLALRCLMVALVVAAFSRPVWLAADSSATSAETGAAVVLLVDASASSAQQVDGLSMLQTLRGAGGRALDALQSGVDLGNLVIASAQPQAAFPRLTANIPALREELGKLAATLERADLPQSLALSGEMLRGHNGPRRLVILSDQQQSNWQELLAKVKVAELLPEGTQVTIVDLPGLPPDNVGLSSPRCFPAQPIAGQATQLLVQVANYSAANKQVLIDAELDGQSLGAQTVTLASGEKRDLSFETRLAGQGEHRVLFAAAADAFLPDNRAYLVISAAERLPVIVISDDPPDEPGSGAYFLTRALAPHGDATDRFQVQQVTSAALANTNLDEAAAVFVGYLGELPPEGAIALSNYLQRGGGLVFFCGEGAADRHLLELERATGPAGALPWQPGGVRNLAALDEALTITGGRWQSRLLREFDEQSQLGIAQIPFRRVWTTGTPHAEAQVLLTFSDNSPALGLRTVGTGELLVANFSPALSASDLGKYGAFVALVQVLARELRPASAALASAFAGQPYRHPTAFEVTGNQPIELLGPDQSPVAATMISEHGKQVVQMQRPPAPGFYSIRQGTQHLATAAILLDPRESDLKRIDRAALLRPFESGGLGTQSSTLNDQQPLLELHGRPLWGWFFAFAMFVIGLELLCLNWWKR